MKTMKTAITTLSLTLGVAPIFACADDHADSAELGGHEAEPEAEPGPSLASFELTVNGARDPQTIDHASVVTLAVDVDQAVGIRGVEFYIDGELLGFDVERPYEVMWPIDDHAANGSYELSAVAIHGDEAIASDTRHVDIELPEPGTPMWTVSGSGWTAIAPSPLGLFVLGEQELLMLDEHGEQQWQKSLGFPATVVTLDRLWYQAVVAAHVDGAIELARVSAFGEVTWTRTVALPELDNLTLESAAMFGDCIALTGHRTVDGVGRAWAAELNIDIGNDEPEVLWARDLRSAVQTFMGAPAYGTDGSLYLATNAMLVDYNYGWVRDHEFARYEAGEKVWSLNDQNAGLGAFTAATVTADGAVHLASFDQYGGGVARYDGDGRWLGANGGIGESVDRLASTQRGVTWAGRGSDDDLAIGRIANNGVMAWQAQVPSDAGKLDLSVDWIGYAYVLSRSSGAAELHKIHP
jgi:hypothetical protein